MATRALILVEGDPTPSGVLFIQAAESLGLHPITLSSDPSQYDYLKTEGYEAICVDTDNIDALIRECSRLSETYDIAGITCSLEASYATVGKLCRNFDLPGPNPTSIERCRDKFVQRQVLANAGIPVPVYRLSANAADVASCAAEIGMPVVLKPAVGAGSSGVRLCRDADEVARHTSYLLGGKHQWRSPPKILVEEFAQGPHYSIETMGNEVIGIGSVDFGPPPHFVSREYIYPAALTVGQQKRIAGISRSCLRVLGLGWGAANIDLRWTKRGPVVIEVNPRLGGTPAPQLLQQAYGVDIVMQHIKLVIGEDWDSSRRHSQVAAARYVVPDRDGTLDWINGEAQAAAMLGVIEVKLYAKPKSTIILQGDYRDKIGHVIAASPSRAQTMAILNCAVDLITWSVKSLPA